MNREFDRVNAALAASVPGRALIFLDGAIRSAWRTSSTGNATRSIGETLRNAPAPRLIQTAAAAIAIAAIVLPLLMMAMPATVAPALPRAAFALVAGFAALVAWQAEAIVNAWPNSRLARLLGR